jgi:hypothetical protein
MADWTEATVGDTNVPALLYMRAAEEFPEISA